MKKVILFLITVMLMAGAVHADTIYPNPDEVAEDLLREQLAEEAESQEEVIVSEPQAQPVPSEPIQTPVPKSEQSEVAKEEKAEEKTEEKIEEPKNKLQKTKEKVKEKEEAAEITSKTEKETPAIPLMIGAVALLSLIALTVFLLTRKDKEDTEEDVSADIDLLYEQMQEKYRP